MTHRTRPPRLLAAVAVSAAVLAACGSDDSPDTADAPAETASAASTSPTTIDDHDHDHDEHDHDHDEHDEHDHDEHDEHEHEHGEEADPGADDLGDDATEVDEPERRLVVSDATEPIAHVVRYDDGAAIATLDLPGTATVSAADRYILATARDADRVEVIDPGTWTESHGDHGHSFVARPTVTEFGFDADDPTHVVEHGGLVAIFNDGDGSVIVIDETAVADSASDALGYDSGAPHHGVAVALAEHGVVLVTTPVADEALPDGVAVVDLDSGEELERFADCPGLHGEAATGRVVAFGCSDGVLVLEPRDDRWMSTKIERPVGTPDDARTGTLAATDDALIGNLGSRAIAMIDIAAGEAAAIDLPVEMSSFAVAPDGSSVLVLTVDGHVHLIDPAAGTITASAPVVEPFELPDGHGGDPVPRVSVTDGHVFVTDPSAGAVVEIDTTTLAEVRRFEVGGAPASVTLAG